MPKRMDNLSKKVNEAGEKLVNEVENVTERVISRVDQMRKRVFDEMVQTRSNDRRRDSRSNLTAVKP